MLFSAAHLLPACTSFPQIQKIPSGCEKQETCMRKEQYPTFFRLDHCRSARYVMHFSNSISHTDYKEKEFCGNRKKPSFSKVRL